jgi:glutamate 5-kinase
MAASGKRIVLKFGTGILTRRDAPEPDPVQLRRLIEAVALVRGAGHQCVVVSSGAVACGLKPVGLDQRPADIASLQACAAVGQTHLMSRYESLLGDHGLHVAQLLVSHDDLTSADRSARFRTTLERLLQFPNVVPVINENDSVAIEELRFGDNDKLSSSIARLWQADLLILLTSAPGLLERADQPDAAPIPLVTDVEAVLHHAGEERSALGSGGMGSKLRAVQEAVEAGIECVIASGRNPGQVPDLVSGGGVCTRFPARPAAQPATPAIPVLS